MHILVTNDDGVTAPGLLALANSMHFDFSRGQVRRSVTTDAQGISLEGPDGKRRVAWSDVTGAGVGVKRPTSLINRLPVDDPRFTGLATAVSLASQVSPATDLLYIAYRPAGKGRQLYTLAIPTSGEARQALLSELAGQLGSRWIAEPMDMMTVRKRLGFANWWVAPSLLVLLVVIAMAIVAWWLTTGRFGQ
jgi:hypothetical protein